MNRFKLIWIMAILPSGLPLSAPIMAADWQHSLYLDGGDYWRARLSVVVTNGRDVALEGEPVPGFVSRAYSFAVFGLGIDYLFMPVYATALALGILLASGRHGSWFATLGAWLGWGAYAAALFDAVENYALARMLMLNEVWSPWPEVAAFSASVKFLLLLFGLFYALVGWLWPKKKI